MVGNSGEPPEKCLAYTSVSTHTEPRGRPGYATIQVWVNTSLRWVKCWDLIVKMAIKNSENKKSRNFKTYQKNLPFSPMSKNSMICRVLMSCRDRREGRGNHMARFFYMYKVYDSHITCSSQAVWISEFDVVICCYLSILFKRNMSPVFYIQITLLCSSEQYQSQTKFISTVNEGLQIKVNHYFQLEQSVAYMYINSKHICKGHVSKSVLQFH